nr:MAG TPA: hypothetical protein [Caudoviricetes sp.]
MKIFHVCFDLFSIFQYKVKIIHLFWQKMNFIHA